MSHIFEFLEPESIAVFGASERVDSMGGRVIQNIVNSGYKGTVLGVNRKRYKSVYGVPCVTELDKDHGRIQLAILCIPITEIPNVIRHLADHHVHSVVIMTGGISRQKTQSGQIIQEINALAKQLGVRIMGPNALGIIVPPIQLNASFSHLYPTSGTTAFVGQSAAMGSALLDYAVGRGLGFSHFIAMGAVTDVDIAEIVDRLAADRRVKSIVLNIEQVHDARRLMTALRAASRTKKVVAIRTGLNDRVPPGLKTRDRVDYRFFRRAGVLEVRSLDALFNSLEVLSRMKPLYFESVAILSNGLGTAMLAKNSLDFRKGHLADIDSLPELGDVDYPYKEDLGLNPLVVPAAATAETYIGLLKQLDRVKGLGAILLIISPNVRAEPESLAKALVSTVKSCRHMVLTCWLGTATVKEARKVFDAHGVLNFHSPNDAVAAFMTMVHHERNQESLRDTPPKSKPLEYKAVVRVQDVIQSAVSEQRNYLTLVEARTVMDAYGYGLVPSRFDVDLDTLLLEAEPIQYPVSLRLVHEAYCYPFAYEDNPRLRWRAVSIQLENEQGIRDAADHLIAAQSERFPNSRILGFGLQPMRRALDSLVFSMGITRDDIVGPLILFGEGGSTADILADRRFGLPPLNSNHTRKLIYRSHAYSVLVENSTDLDQDVAALSEALKTLSQMVVDNPEIAGLETNLLLLPTHEVMVLGVAIQIGSPVPTAIAPYPSYLTTDLVLKNGDQLSLRPIRADDENPLKVFFERMSPEALRYRFFGSRLQFEHRELAAMCQIDYVREMAFVAVDDAQTILGEIRTWRDVLRDEIEFAVMVDPALQGQGFGTQLMARMIAYSRELGIVAINAEVMSDNEPMLRLSKGCGFSVVHNDDGVISVRLELQYE